MTIYIDRHTIKDLYRSRIIDGVVCHFNRDGIFVAFEYVSR